MTEDIKFPYVKVLHPAVKKAVYLEQPKLVTKDDIKFISGTECDKEGETKIVKGGTVMHLLQLGEGVTVIGMKHDNFYGIMEEIEEIKL
jgi:hypothetical protein